VFYGWWDWRFLFLLIGTGLIDFWCGLAMQYYPKFKKIFFITSLIGNLGTLSLFKYSVFFAKTLDSFANLFGINTHFIDSIPHFTLVLPVGISFYTFQSLSYSIDVYRGRLEPTKNVLHFFSFLSMFPQLVAGPIIRAKDILKQLMYKRLVSDLAKWNAIKLIAYGLFQKVVIADNLSFLIDSAFENKTAFSGGFFWWIIIFAFAFQIYSDFSGYSLIARGLAKYMGYHFRMNFNHPYLATSLKNFWSRWHISLSTWFRDYVYIPLGGSRKGIYYGLLFLSITMILSGLWHGANLTFILWGVIHAFFLCVERITNWNKWFKLKNIEFVLIPIIFIQVCFAWVFFRADSTSQAFTICKELVHFTSLSIDFFKTYFNSLLFLIIAVCIEVAILLKNKNFSLSLFYKRNHLDIVVVAFAIISILFFRGEGHQFIYFQF